jgi:hypothetical protein
LETEHFIKERFGWVCRRCRDAASHAATDDTERASQTEGRARFFREGEAEEREPHLSTRALARRREADGGRILFCPNCGAEEISGVQ